MVLWRWLWLSHPNIGRRWNHTDFKFLITSAATFTQNIHKRGAAVLVSCGRCGSGVRNSWNLLRLQPSALEPKDGSFSRRMNSTFVPREDEGPALSSPVNDEESMHTNVLFRDLDPDEHLSHLRIKLYPSDPDPCHTLSKIYEADSVQEILTIMEGTQEDNVKFSSQALVTLWDLQKLLFKLGPYFSPESDIFNKAKFVEDIKNHFTFQTRILQPILFYYKDLEDEALCASLLVLNRFSIPLVDVEPLYLECSRRKGTLELPGLSRLSVCIRSEGLYGYYTMANFLPLITKYVESMKTDLEVRLVCITLKNIPRLISSELTQTYFKQLQILLQSDETFETVTYCKMLLVLLDLGKEGLPLLRKVGKILAPRVPSMDIMEVLSLQKFLLGSVQEPFCLVNELLQKNLRLIEEEESYPRLDLLAATTPYLKSLEQRKMLSSCASEYMDRSNFDVAIHVLHTIIRGIRTNEKEVYNKYWANVLSYLEKSPDLKKVTISGKNYMYFAHSLLFSYRNIWFESIMKRYMYQILDGYLNGSTDFLNPSEFATIIAFLIAFDQHFLELRYVSKLSDFAPQLKPMDFYLVCKGVDAAMMNLFFRRNAPSRNYDTVIQICSILEEEVGLRLLQNVEPFNNNELVAVCRMALVVTKVKGESPLFDMAMNRILQNGFHDSREVREVCNALANGQYFYPEVMSAMVKFIEDNKDVISPETFDRFLQLSYLVGWDSESHDDFPFSKFKSYLKEHWEKFGVGILNTAVALAFHHQLHSDMVKDIFTVDFLDQIDNELSLSFGNTPYYPMKLRMTLMVLNRTVCMDLPNVNLPWFHEKFCETLVSGGKSKGTYLNAEVFNVLNDLVGENAVLTDVCLPKDYYYPIDFVLEFDQQNRPIRRKRNTSFFRLKSDVSSEVGRKVAILVLNQSSFTKNVRSIKGSVKLKQRHLEILGYKVVQIDPYVWNSMYMSENQAKQTFLESQIFE